MACTDVRRNLKGCRVLLILPSTHCGFASTALPRDYVNEATDSDNSHCKEHDISPCYLLALGTLGHKVQYKTHY